MSTKVIMPQMGESIFEGTITKWLKKVGERVVRDEPLFEISTDKVDSEIPAPVSGTLNEILVFEGQTVQINTVVAVIGEGTAATPSLPEPVKPVSASPQELQPARAPAAESPSPAAITSQSSTPAPEPPPHVRTAETPATTPRELRASPLVRRLARENRVDLSAVPGTGFGGRVSKQDMLSYIDQIKGTPLSAPAPPVAAQTPMKPESPKVVGEIHTVPMTTMRKSIAEHMVLSKRTSAHVNTVFEVDVSSIVRLREAHRELFEARTGVKLTYTPFIAKALVDALHEFPILNCSVSGDNIFYKRAINVGIAVALDTGLIVPVIKDAHLKSFTGIAQSIHDLAERARTKKLKPEDVQGGTITITNPGVYGGLFGTPIINQPQVAILGVGGIERRPVVVNDAIAIRSMVYLSLSFDHRVIDGAVADQFMANLKARLQSWTQWVE